MKTQTQILKPILLITLFSALLVACSVEQKPTTDDTIGKTEAVDAPTPFESSTEHVEQSKPAAIEMPKSKPPLSNQQLFSGTLDAHNRIRAKHGLKPLKWSDKLAAYSQEWADHLGRGNSCKMYHRSGSPPYGENLYISTATVWTEGNKEVARERNRVTIKDVVKVWTDEEKWYNYKNNSCQPGRQCGHYTQVVWRETTEVGCAVKYCNDASQNWVCSYNPPGNYVGKRPY